MNLNFEYRLIKSEVFTIKVSSTMKLDTAISVENKTHVTITVMRKSAAITNSVSKYDMCKCFVISFCLVVTYSKFHLECKKKLFLN